MKHATRLALVLSMIAAIVIVDQATKAAARVDLRLDVVHRVVGNILVFVRVENNGAFLSLGSTWNPAARRIVFSVLTGAMTVLLVLYLIRSSRATPLQTLALAAVAGGGVSNIIDRIVRNGLVTDFLNVGIGNVRTGIFNLADFFILTGVIMFVVTSLGGEGSRRRD